MSFRGRLSHLLSRRSRLDVTPHHSRCERPPSQHATTSALRRPTAVSTHSHPLSPSMHATSPFQQEPLSVLSSTESTPELPLAFFRRTGAQHVRTRLRYRHHHHHHHHHLHNHNRALSTSSITQAMKIDDLSSLPPRIGHHVNKAVPPDTGDINSSESRWHWQDSKKPGNVLIIKKHGDEVAAECVHEIAAWMMEKYPDTNLLVEPKAGHEYPYLLTYDASSRSSLSDIIDFIIIVGGDGTMLHVSSLFENDVPPVLSFSLGTLGFLMPYQFCNFRDAISSVVNGGVPVTSRMRLKCTIQTNDDKNQMVVQVMNEVAVHRGHGTQLLGIDCSIDDEFITHSSGDGLLVATSTGSTAYSLSAGGSLVHPAIHSILITPICPRSLSFRPALLPKHTQVKLTVASDSRVSGVIDFDGRNSHVLQSGDSVMVEASPNAVTTFNRSSARTSEWLRDMFELLNWNQPTPGTRRPITRRKTSSEAWSLPTSPPTSSPSSSSSSGTR